MTPYKLRKLYKMNTIRKKKIRHTKILNEIQKRKIRFQIPKTREALNYYRERGFRIIYLDEMMVTKSSMPTHAWSSKRTSIDIDYH